MVCQKKGLLFLVGFVLLALSLSSTGIYCDDD